MRVPALLAAFAFLPLAGSALAEPHYDRPVHIITSDYDQVDTTYIDRGRLDGVRVGDRFQVQFPDGKVVTDVVVTAVFENMAAVKIVDSWFLKNGQIAGYSQRPMVVPIESIARRTTPASWSRRHRHRHGEGPAAATASAAAPAPSQAPAKPAVKPDASAASASAPAAPAAPGSDSSLPPPDASGAGLPASDSAGALPPPPDGGPADASLPPPSDSAPTPAPAGAPAGGSDANIPPPPE